MSETVDQDLVPGSAPLMYTFETSEVRVAIAHWRLKGDPEIIETALQNVPSLITKLVWENLELPARLAAAQEGHINPENLVSNDMTRVFTEKTSRFLSAWQSLINSHAVWHADFEIGKLAHDLIERGILMAAHEKGTSWHGNEIMCRFDHTPGLPGSPQFVAAMMGLEYAQWLAGIP